MLISKSKTDELNASALQGYCHAIVSRFQIPTKSQLIGLSQWNSRTLKDKYYDPVRSIKIAFFFSKKKKIFFNAGNIIQTKRKIQYVIRRRSLWFVYVLGAALPCRNLWQKITTPPHNFQMKICLVISTDRISYCRRQDKGVNDC